MKVEVCSKIKPVIITLETQSEIDLFASLLGALRPSIVETFGADFEQVFNLEGVLHQAATPTRKPFVAHKLVD